LTRLAAFIAIGAALGVSLFAGSAPSTSNATTELTVYSGRDERFVGAMYRRFTRLTGIELKVRYGDSATLAATLVEEGRNSPADVFVSQDAGALGAVASRGLLRVLPQSILGRVPARFRAPGKRWLGVSGRARVVVYNTSELRPSQLPATIWGYTQPRWKGKVGLPPTNASFQAFVSAMRLRAGDDRTRDWLLALRENDVRFYSGNSQVVAAVARGEIQVGFVNHYYLYQLREEQPDAAAANHFLRGKNDPGALINVAGAGVVARSSKAAAAQRLLAFLLGREAQRYFARSPGRAEYPLAAGVRPRAGLPPLSSIEGARVSLGRLGRELESTLELLNEVGYTR
jgi:iron(III) transport system substrate-binding protein